MDSPDPAIRAGVAQDLVFLNFVGIRVVVVHGGGKAVTRKLESRGLKAKFVNGLRITELGGRDHLHRRPMLVGPQPDGPSLGRQVQSTLLDETATDPGL